MVRRRWLTGRGLAVSVFLANPKSRNGLKRQGSSRWMDWISCAEGNLSPVWDFGLGDAMINVG